MHLLTKKSFVWVTHGIFYSNFSRQFFSPSAWKISQKRKRPMRIYSVILNCSFNINMDDINIYVCARMIWSLIGTRVIYLRYECNDISLSLPTNLCWIASFVHWVYTGFLGVADYNIMIQGGLLLSVSMFDLFNVSPMFVLTHSCLQRSSGVGYWDRWEGRLVTGCWIWLLKKEVAMGFFL